MSWWTSNKLTSSQNSICCASQERQHSLLEVCIGGGKGETSPRTKWLHVYVSPYLCVTISMGHRVYVSSCLCVSLIPCCPCVYVSPCLPVPVSVCRPDPVQSLCLRVTMSLCHYVYASPCLCVTMSACRSHPMLSLCLCVNMSNVYVSQCPCVTVSMCHCVYVWVWSCAVPVSMCPHPCAAPHVVRSHNSKTSSLSMP